MRRYPASLQIEHTGRMLSLADGRTPAGEDGTSWRNPDSPAGTLSTTRCLRCRSCANWIISVAAILLVRSMVYFLLRFFSLQSLMLPLFLQPQRDLYVCD